MKLFGRDSTLTRYGVLASADVASRGLAFLATLLIVREFKDAAFGHIGVATSVVAYALMASTCGLDIHAVRHVARHTEDIGRYASTFMALRSTLGVFAYLALMAICALVPQLRDIWPLVALFGLTLFSGSLSLTWVPQALQKSGVLAAANFTIGAVYFAGVVLTVTLHGPLWSVPLAQVAAESCAALGLYLWLRKTVGPLEQPLPATRWVDILRESWPIGGSWLMRTVALGSDLLLLRLLYVQEDSIGWYNGASRLFMLLNGLSALYFVILFPRLSQKAVQSAMAFRHEAVQSMGRVFVVAGGAAIALALLAPFVLQLLFAPSFVGAATALRILGVAALVSVIGNHFRYMLLATGRQHLDLRNASATALLHVVFKLLFIPAFGINGAAMGTLCGEITVLLFGIWSARTNLFLPRAAA